MKSAEFFELKGWVKDLMKKCFAKTNVLIQSETSSDIRTGTVSTQYSLTLPLTDNNLEPGTYLVQLYVQTAPSNSTIYFQNGASHVDSNTRLYTSYVCVLEEEGKICFGGNVTGTYKYYSTIVKLK